MGFKLNTEIRAGYIRGVTFGEIRTAADILSKVEALLRVSREAGFYRFLMDERRLGLYLDAHECSLAANLLEKEGVQTFGGRMACLYNPTCESAFRLAETMYRNRSMSYALFRSEAEGLAWLMR